MTRVAAALFALALGAWACAESDPPLECERNAECTEAPSATCAGDTLVTYESAGVCIAETCRYAAFETPCDAGCVAEGSGGGAACAPTP